MAAALMGGASHYTGETLGDRKVFDNTEGQTSFIRSGIDNYTVSAILPAWDKVLSRTVLDPLFSGLRTLRQAAPDQSPKVTFSADSFIDGSAIILTTWALEPQAVTAYDAVRYVEATLGVPVTDVTKACGISRRTFYSWKKLDAGQPRLASEGRLWALVQTVEDLVDILGGHVARWMREDPTRREMLVSGKFDELAASLTTARVRADERTRMHESAPVSVSGEDVSMPRMTERRVPTRARRTRRVDSRTGGNGKDPTSTQG